MLCRCASERLVTAVFFRLQEFSQAFVSSIGDWSPSETLRVGQDPGGSRVLEALVNASAASKAKKKLLRKLKGMWAILAVEPGGNHVVESCFVWGVSFFITPNQAPSITCSWLVIIDYNLGSVGVQAVRLYRCAHGPV